MPISEGNVRNKKKRSIQNEIAYNTSFSNGIITLSFICISYGNKENTMYCVRSDKNKTFRGCQEFMALLLYFLDISLQFCI